MDAGRIGLIGLGNMGSRMARRMVDAGRSVVGFDVSPKNVTASGVQPVDSIKEVAERSNVVLLSLPDSKAVESVVFQEQGLLSASRPGQVVVDLGTSSPRSTVALRDKFSERDVEFIDAGISGGAAAAEKGTLTIMVGGATEAFERIASVFEPIAAKVFFMGPSGAGHTAKLLNNFLNGVSLAATAEVMVAGKKAGLDLDTLLDVLNNSSGINFATINRFPRIVHGDYLEGGLTGDLMMKDIVLYVECLKDLGVPTLNASGPMASFGVASHLGYGNVISNRVVDAIGDLAGGVRLDDTSIAET